VAKFFFVPLEAVFFIPPEYVLDVRRNRFIKWRLGITGPLFSKEIEVTQFNVFPCAVTA
jgi:hypothetical protein